MLRLEPSPTAVGRARATIDRFEGRLPAQTIEDAFGARLMTEDVDRVELAQEGGIH